MAFLLLVMPFFNLQAKCEVSLANTEINNQEFYVNFTKEVEKIFRRHGYDIVAAESQNHFTTKNYITTGTNYFRLKQVNIKFDFTQGNKILDIHVLKNCITVSCPLSSYLKALKSALKKLDHQLPNCQS